LEDAQVVNLIVRRAAAGDSLAWEDLVHRFKPPDLQHLLPLSPVPPSTPMISRRKFSIKMYKTLSTYDVERAAFMTW